MYWYLLIYIHIDYIRVHLLICNDIYWYLLICIHICLYSYLSISADTYCQLLICVDFCWDNGTNFHYLFKSFYFQLFLLYVDLKPIQPSGSKPRQPSQPSQPAAQPGHQHYSNNLVSLAIMNIRLDDMFLVVFIFLLLLLLFQHFPKTRRHSNSFVFVCSMA